MSDPLPPLPAEDLEHVLARTGALWAEAKGASFFITGGTGFFGRWLLETFCRANDKFGLGMRATVLTRDPAAFTRKAPHLAARADLQWLAGDVRDFSFPAGKFSHVIHAATAASAQLNEEAPLEMFDTIVAGTRRVLELAAQAGTQKFLLTSSGAVYGQQPSGLTHVPEDYAGGPDPLAPASAYAEGKRAAEQLCTLYARAGGLEVKIARCFAFVGPHLPLDAHFAIGNFIRDALRGDTIRVGGDGTPRRSYLYAADLTVWLWTILFRAPSLRPYNVGSAEAVSIAELAAAVATEAGEPSAVSIAKTAVPGAPETRYVPAVARAHAELGLIEHIRLPEAIRRTIQWHRSSIL